MAIMMHICADVINKSSSFVRFHTLIVHSIAQMIIILQPGNPV